MRFVSSMFISLWVVKQFHESTDTTLISVFKTVFLVNAVTCSDNVATSALPLCYKKWHRPLNTMVTSLSKKMSYQQNTIAAFRQSYGAGSKIFSIWVKPRKTRKNSNLQDHEANPWHKSQTRSYSINPLNAELNPICHLLKLLRAHPILHFSRIRVKLRLM
jgi:hypothetical protein